MKQLTEILKGIRPEFDFSASTNFIADGLLDSFDITLLVAALDKTFGISIDGGQIIPENFTNVEAISQLLSQYGVPA
jgi:acyl carrier protein